MVEAKRRGILLSNDSQIFLEVAPCRVIGITGSAGKTTTTTLVGRIAQAAFAGSDRTAWVGGNIGSPLITDVDRMCPQDLAVMELSSFQLEIMTRSPQVAAVLNITPNHLDRHSYDESVHFCERAILLHQTSSESVILGRDDPGAWALVKKARGQIFSFGLSELPADQRGVFLRDGTIFVRTEYQQPGVNHASMMDMEPIDQPVISMKDIALRGEHNLLNAMAACAIAAAAGLPIEAMQSGIKDFNGVPHRLEFVRTWGGADWYNDSIATAPERAMAAIRSFDEPLVLLAGGRDKNLPWDDFARLVRGRVDHLILFGESAELIFRKLELTQQDRVEVVCCKGLREAVEVAEKVVKPGDVVLLSPGGTSFDEFKDFEERGRYFSQLVGELP